MSANSPTWSWMSSATPGTLYSSPSDWFMRSSMTRRWVSTCRLVVTNQRLCVQESVRGRSVRLGGATYLGSDLRRLLGVHHAHVLEVLECVLPVLLLGAHVLLQQAEDVTGLKRDGRDTLTHSVWNATRSGSLLGAVNITDKRLFEKIWLWSVKRCRGQRKEILCSISKHWERVDKFQRVRLCKRKSKYEAADHRSRSVSTPHACDQTRLLLQTSQSSNCTSFFTPGTEKYPQIYSRFGCLLISYNIPVKFKLLERLGYANPRIFYLILLPIWIYGELQTSRTQT